MSDRPIPNRLLIPLAVACIAVSALTLLGAPDLVLIPAAAATVLWSSIMIARHYLTNRKD